MKHIEITHLDLRYSHLRVLCSGRVAHLTASILRDAQQTPVLVTKKGVLVDGYHRVKALIRLGHDLVYAQELDLDDTAALIWTWRLERTRRRSPFEEAWLIAELIESHALSLGQISEKMGRSKSWLSERLGLLRALPESAQVAVRDETIPVNAAMKSLVPMARIDREACAQIVTNLSGSITVREWAQLYSAWRRADSEGRVHIVEKPRLFLKMEAAIKTVPIAQEETLTRHLESLARLCHRARVCTREGAFPRGNNSATVRAWNQVIEAFQALNEEVDGARS